MACYREATLATFYIPSERARHLFVYRIKLHKSGYLC
jgi:hypothetical protein